MRSYFTKALLLTCFILLFSFNSVSASTDIEGSYGKDAILELVEKGIIAGDEGGDFNPSGNITRQDFAIILAKALELDTTKEQTKATYTDVPANHYTYEYVEAAVQAGLISGTGKGDFGNNTNLSREDMAAIFVQALGAETSGYDAKLTFSDTVNKIEWAKDAVANAVEIGLINGESNSFNPQMVADREQVALVSSKFSKLSQ